MTQDHLNEGQHLSVKFETALEMLKSLIASRTLVKERLSDQSVQEVFNSIGVVARSGEERSRLDALSVLGKAAEISKPIADLVHPILQSGLREALPHTGSWGAADDRYYLAKAISSSSAQWVAEYAAVELARADVAERKSREVWAEIAISRSIDLASALKAIERAFGEDRSASGEGVDTACRKLNRVLGALVTPLSLADLPLGEGFGQSFSNLVAIGGGKTGPENRSLRDETAAAVLETMVQLLRLRFAASLDASIYNAARTALGWWKPARPSESINKTADRLVAIAMDALHVLARQGVTEKVVRQSIVSAFTLERVNAYGEYLSQRDPSLSADVSVWLATGKEAVRIQQNDAVRDLNEQALDEILANLLIAVARQDHARSSLDMMADDIEILEPNHAMTIRATASRARLVTQWANAAGAKRRLRLFGDLGEIVSFDPAVHISDDNLQISSRARVRTSGVVKELDGRPASIVVKAQVEGADRK